ncbi:MAG: histidine kinase [Kineosporiaceae bacterium]
MALDTAPAAAGRGAPPVTSLATHPVTSRPPTRRPLWRMWLLGWPALGHLVLDALLAAPALLLVTLTFSGLLGTAAVAGLPAAALGLVIGFVAAEADRWRIQAWTGLRVPRWAPRPAHLPAWRRVLFDPRPWRAQLYFLFLSVWGVTAGLLMAALLVTAVVGLVIQVVPPSLVTDTSPAADPRWRPVIAAGAASALLALPFLARLLVHVDAGVARLLLGRGRDEEVEQLTRRVDTLTQTRQAAVDSVDAERRRIERDLHDGPQQRLVAVAMDLGLARQRLAAEDTAGASTLLERAHSGAKEAITEMRRVARGIHPPVLTDRGLDAALSALAARSPVPVSVRVDLPHRPAARLEAIAYFSVSEALTNVAKHSRARTARVRVEERYGPEGAVLVATVTDDGVGGADPTRGTGLAGLRDRVAAVDGRVLVSSPPGGPTVVTIELPFAPAGEQPRTVRDDRDPHPTTGRSQP